VTALALVDTWGAPHAAAAVVAADGIVAVHGDHDHEYRIASVTKLITAYAALIAVEEGTIELDEPAAREGATVRHLLAHAAGYGFDGPEPIAAVAARRIYSNTGIERLADHLAAKSGMPFTQYLADAVLVPLGMGHTELRGSAAHGVYSTLADVCRFAVELLAPRLVDASTLAEAVRVQFPGLPGILPGVGRFTPLDWGLGFERNFARPGHWAGSRVSTDAFGHFGGSGTFLVVDPSLPRALVCLTDREFGPWALDAWPPFCDAVFTECAEAVGS
jgi:CubicO group peptidase (beta-lactamase class C family)